jgi:AAA15 family ATPase/GTPase
MKIRRLVINNYLSFKKSEIIFEDYNIIVGQNASGKTNIRRTLELLCDNVLGPNLRRLEELRINPDSVLDKHKPTCIAIDLLLSNNEAKMLFQILFKRATSNVKCANLRKVIIILNWEDNRNSIPNKIFLIMANSLVLEKAQNTDGLFYAENIPADLSLLRRTSEEQKQIFNDAELVTKFQKKHHFHFSQLLQNIRFQRLVLNCKCVPQYFSLDSRSIKIPVSNLFVTLNEQEENRYLQKIFEYCNIPSDAGYQLDIWAFIRSLLSRNISIYQYIAKDVDYLARRIFDFEKTIGVRSGEMGDSCTSSPYAVILALSLLLSNGNGIHACSGVT